MGLNRHTLTLLLSLSVVFAAPSFAFAQYWAWADPTPPVFAASQTDLYRQPPQIMPRINVPIIHVSASGTTFASGAPITISMQFTNTVGRVIYTHYTGRFSDWNLQVYYLGTDGRQPPELADKTALGEEELSRRRAVYLNITIPVGVGSMWSGVPIPVNRLFDMHRRGVYAIWVSQTVSPEEQPESQLLLSSPPLRVTIQ